VNAPANAAGRIGPNAVTRVAEALTALFGPGVAASVFRSAGLTAWWLAPPTRMVDEANVQALYQALHRLMGSTQAEHVTREAGERTAAYLLAHRIPKAFARLLKLLPARLAARLLLVAIARHAWTFAGSGRFSHEGPRLLGQGQAFLTIRHNPLCVGLAADHPVCSFHAAVFEHLFAVLVHPASRVRELSCEAAGAQACRFEVSWPP
jgi:divinyl protochlorophyllide a 8-vinyl-reductase